MSFTEVLSKGLAGEETISKGRKEQHLQHSGPDNAPIYYQVAWFFPVITPMVWPPIPDDDRLSCERKTAPF